MRQDKQNKSKFSIFGLLFSFISFTTGIIAVVGYRLEWWRHIKAFSIFGWATYMAIIAITFLIVSLYINHNSRQKKVWILDILGILLALPILIGTALFNYAATVYPPINDISTDTKNPPSYWNMPNPMEYPQEKFAIKQHKAYPDLVPLVLSQTPKKVFDKALKIVNKNGWKLVSKDREEEQIEAVASSLFFGFKDEVVIRIQKTKNGTLVDIRSRSRIGKIDRGANAKRIRGFIKALKN